MMNQQPDKLFRDKLHDFRRPVSANAWSRVEQQLEKKHNKLIWLKIAAAVLLVVTSVFVISTNEWFDGNNNNRISVRNHRAGQQDENARTDRKKDFSPKDSATHNEPTSAKKKGVVKEKVEKTKEAKKVQRKTTRQNDVHAIDNSLLTEVKEVTIDSVDMEHHHTAIDDNSPNTLATANNAHGRKFVYAANEVNEKYLNKNSLADATDEKKKESTLKKVLDKAYDLKNNQDPIGDLRQMKNEILAMNFKNEKSRSQNR